MERPSFWKFRETKGDEYQSGPETSMIQYGRPNKGQTKVGILLPNQVIKCNYLHVYYCNPYAFKETYFSSLHFFASVDTQDILRGGIKVK